MGCLLLRSPGDLTAAEKADTVPFNFFIPVDPADTRVIRGEPEAVMAERGDEYRQSRLDISVAEEKVFLQNTIVGPGVAIYWETADHQASLRQLIDSQNPFDF